MLAWLGFAHLLFGVDSSPAMDQIRARVIVRTKIRADAEACMIHLHGNEALGRAVMMDLAKTTCTNVLWFDDAIRKGPWPHERIPVPMATGQCSVNPNRVLTAAGFDARIAFDCADDPIARKELRRFLDDMLLPAIAKCRAGNLPVVAFHNNSNMTLLDLDTKATFEIDRKSHNILFVTREDDMERLSSLKRWNVGLQSTPPGDDGSLSVLLANERYINVEAHIAQKNERNNRAMGEWALRSVGAFTCGDGNWAP